MADGSQDPAGEPEKEIEKEKEKVKEPVSQTPREKTVNVILVADIDLLYSAFFNIRARGQDEEADVNLNLDNVTFVLNALDELAGDKSFIEIRKRRPAHRTLEKFEQATAESRIKVLEATERFRKEFEDKRQAEQKKLDDEVAKIQKQKDVDAADHDAANGSRAPGRAEASADRRGATGARTGRSDQDGGARLRTRDARQAESGASCTPCSGRRSCRLLMGVAVFFNRRARSAKAWPRAASDNFHYSLSRVACDAINLKTLGAYPCPKPLAPSSTSPWLARCWAWPMLPARVASRPSPRTKPGPSSRIGRIPLAPTSLEVVEYDEDTGTVHPFKVQQVDGKWSIPSHSNYPTDAERQLGEAAASVFELQKLSLVTQRQVGTRHRTA